MHLCSVKTSVGSQKAEPLQWDTEEHFFAKAFRGWSTAQTWSGLGSIKTILMLLLNWGGLKFPLEALDLIPETFQQLLSLTAF